MKHMTREQALHRRVLQRARTVAVIGASSNPARHSHAVMADLNAAGYDVIPVCPDRGDVAGLQTYPTQAHRTLGGAHDCADDLSRTNRRGDSCIIARGHWHD
jgi:hypothetical protein